MLLFKTYQETEIANYQLTTASYIIIELLTI